ncbi:MAG: TfoX/Sxy family protein [Proteobacteria bacterium]|nr:TfoX/Sxy family protein [Pseudomonadota bacterium]
MPYDPGLAERLEEIFDGRSGFAKKKMFGGICWMLNGDMCVGIYKDLLIIRADEGAARILKQKHAKPMDITGKPMKGWAMVAPEGYENDKALKRFVDLAVKFVESMPPRYTCQLWLATGVGGGYTGTHDHFRPIRTG